jgi:hypothetical protein
VIRWLKKQTLKVGFMNKAKEYLKKTLKKFRKKIVYNVNSGKIHNET